MRISLRSTITAAWVASAAALSPAAGQGPLASESAAAIPHTRFVLANGLQVVLHENHAAPVASVELWIHAGGRDDPPGRAGLAHLVEHVMGEGSAHSAPNEFAQVVQRAGGVTNAVTSEDRTTYFTVVPSNVLETVLWLEADRLASRLSSLDQKGADAGRAAVLNERALRYERPAYGAAEMFTPASLFPLGHPYNRSPIGAITDVKAATIDELRSFAARFYWPGNAVLVVAGDIDPVRTKRWIESYFSVIPHGPAVTHSPVDPLPAAIRQTEKRVVLEDSLATSARLRLAWVGPGTRHADKAAMQMLGKVLGVGSGSPLRRQLITELRLATQLSVLNADLEESGIFQIEIIAAAGASLTEIERAVDVVLDAVRSRPLPPDMLRRAINDSLTASIVGLQLTKARADILAEGVLFHKDPAALLKARDRFAAVTPADVQRVAREYLTPGRMVMSMVPAGKLDQIAKPMLPYENVTGAIRR